MTFDFLSITLINLAVGLDVSKHKETVAISENKRFPVPRNITSYPALTLNRRRTSGGISLKCQSDSISSKIWCVNAATSCDFGGDDHTKWVIEIDHDTEWMCYPSSCSAKDLQNSYILEMEYINASARYCSLGCPAIQFDISGTSEDGQTWSVNGMYHSANLSYDCAGAVALTEISMCQARDSCPNHAYGVTTCSKHFEDRVSLPNESQTQKVCLPDECTDDANLKKMEDFDYAKRAYELQLTKEQIRAWYSVNYSCSTEAKLSMYVLIYGVAAAVLFVLCLGALGILRFCRGGGVVTTPIVTVEFNNREAFTRLESAMQNPHPSAGLG